MEQPVDYIRESARISLNLNRRLQRDEESNSRRSIKDSSITAQEITNIANKLKTKSFTTVEELHTLKNGLLSDQKYIEIVLNVHGALRGIIRELTGQDVQKQIAAAGCCCNLALGNTKACTAIAKHAGSYITTELNSLTTELAITCAWTVGNLAGSSLEVSNILASQGALSKLCGLFNNEDLQDAVVYSLAHFAYQMKDQLRRDFLNRVMKMFSNLNFTMASSNLLFILSCHDDFPRYVSEDLVHKILLQLPPSIESHFKCYQNKICCQFVYLIRTLANLNMEQYHSVIINYFLVNNMSMNFKRVLHLNNVTVNNSLLWLLGNLYNYCDSEFFTLLIS